MDLTAFEHRCERGGRLAADEALVLYRQAPIYWLGRMADSVRRRKHPEKVVTNIIDRNVCGQFMGTGSENLNTAYRR